MIGMFSVLGKNRRIRKMYPAVFRYPFWIHVLTIFNKNTKSLSTVVYNSLANANAFTVFNSPIYFIKK